MCLRERFWLNGYIILLYLHLSSSRYLTSQAGSFSHVLLKCSFTFGSSDLFGRYSKCAWDSDLSAQDCYTTYLNYYGTVSSRLWVKRTKPFSTPKPLFCFGSVGPRPQFCGIEKSLGLLLSPNCKGLVIFHCVEANDQSLARKYFLWYQRGSRGVPASYPDVSLSMNICAQRKAGRRTPSHGP